MGLVCKRFLRQPTGLAHLLDDQPECFDWFAAHIGSKLLGHNNRLLLSVVYKKGVNCAIGRVWPCSTYPFSRLVQTDAHPIAHFVTRVVGIDGSQEPLEIEVFIRRGKNPEPVIHKEEPLAFAPTTGRRGSPYIHSFTTNLSEANKQGLDNMTYWGTGRKKSKTYLINQALAQYLPRHEESQRPIPLDEV